MVLPLALHRKIAAQGSTFEVVGQENTAQVRVALKTNTEQVENLALQPVCALPDRHQRIHNRLLPADACAQANSLNTGKRYKLVVQFKTRLDGETIHAGSVTQQIEPQCGAALTFLGGGAQQFLGNDNRGLSTILNNLRYSLSVPCAKVFNHNTSAFFADLRHVTVILEGRRYFLA